LGKVLVVQHLALNLLGDTVCLIEVVAIDLKSDGGCSTDSTHTLGNCSFLDFWIFPEVLTDDVRDLGRRAFTVFHRAKVDVHRNNVGAV